jgi:RimJ/RimL family protein N-acetyltransferase
VPGAKGRLEPPHPRLEDGFIRLVPLEDEHLDGMAALGVDAETTRFTYVPVPFDRDAARNWLDGYVRGWLEGTLAGFAIEPADGAGFLGFIALVRFDAEGRQAEIGYIVAAPARGKGVAGRALRLVSDWCLHGLGLRRIELRIDVENVPSVHVAERLGYVREGVLRSVHLKQGLRIDQAVYSLLPADVGLP